jgi:hypothetical protein
MSDEKPPFLDFTVTPERIAQLIRQLDAAVALACSPNVRIADGYRAASWGDPGFQPRDRAVVGFGRADQVDFSQSQIVMVRPRFVIYRIVPRPGQVKLSRDQLQVLHSGQYVGSETAAPLIAAEIFQKHVHQERIEPISKRIDVIQVQMPDGALRVFRREGNELAEKRVPRTESLIMRGLGSPLGG